MNIFTRNWQLKIVSFLLSLLLWMILHYSKPPKKAVPKRRAAAVSVQKDLVQ